MICKKKVERRVKGWADECLKKNLKIDRNDTIMRRRMHPLDEFTTAAVEPVPEYIEDQRDDPVAGPSRDNLAVDGLEDELWANLGVNCRATPAE